VTRRIRCKKNPSFVVLQAKSDCKIRVLMSFVVTTSFDAKQNPSFAKIRVLMSFVVTTSFDAKQNPSLPRSEF
jgi:hypothetical protein